MVSTELIFNSVRKFIMGKSKRVWIVWKCWKCGRTHKNRIRGIMSYRWMYSWEWECDKCRKINVITLRTETRGKLE